MTSAAMRTRFAAGAGRSSWMIAYSIPFRNLGIAEFNILHNPEEAEPHVRARFCPSTPKTHGYCTNGTS